MCIWEKCAPEFHNDFWHFYFIFKNNFTRINHCKFIHHKSHLKPFLSYLPCIVCGQYFSIIFNVKKCALYSVAYRTKPGPNFQLSTNPHVCYALTMQDLPRPNLELKTRPKQLLGDRTPSTQHNVLLGGAYYSKTMFLGLSQVYYWRFKCNTQKEKQQAK